MIRRPPSTNGNGSNEARTPNGVIPTRQAVPPVGRHAIACSIVARSPIASKHVSGPPSVRSRIARTWRLHRHRRAPCRSPRGRERARASRRRDRPRRSAAAPATEAPITTDRPTPPSPITATLEPAATSAVLSAAPTPVVAQHPISAATSARRAVRHRDRGGRRHVLAVGERPDRAVGEDLGAGRPAERNPARRHPVCVRRALGAAPHAAALDMPGNDRTGSATTTRRAGPGGGSGTPRRHRPRAPPRRPTPRGPARSGRPDPTLRRGREGRNGRRRLRPFGRGPHRVPAARARGSRCGSARPGGPARPPGSSSHRSRLEDRTPDRGRPRPRAA